MPPKQPQTKKKQSIYGTLGIDVGQEHMAICLKFSDDPVFKFYLFSFIDPLKKNVPYCLKLHQLHEQLENVYNNIAELTNQKYKLSPIEVIKNIHIEQQIAEVNIKYQYAIMMWFVIKGFKIYPQQASIKYQVMEKKMSQQQMETTALTYRQNSMNKVKGQYYVMVNYIDKGLVDISYQSDFGKNSSKHTKTGQVRMTRWYTDNTKQFVQKYNIDKLDDIADSLLIVVASMKDQQTTRELQDPLKPIDN